MKTMLFIMIPVLLLITSTAVADVVVFKSGAAKQGIIEEETPTTVKMRVKDVVVGIMRDNIERIEYATPEENRDLELKWSQERKQLEEEREKRRAERERLDAEQKAKGMVNVGGEWMTPAQVEAARQESVRQQIQVQRQAEADAEEAAEGAPEEELPPEFQDMPEELRAANLENLRRQKQIVVSQVLVESQGAGRSVVRGTVINGSNALAGSVTLIIRAYGDAEEPILTDTAKVGSVAPNRSAILYKTIRLSADLIKRVEVNVHNVDWK